MCKRSLLRKMGVAFLSLCMLTGLLTGCGDSNESAETKMEVGEKVFYYGDTTFNAENDESDVNPHNGYSGP